MSDCYTAITFAPVQGFIEKSRKLRDLYGSSFILSYLADRVCEAARDYFECHQPWPQDPVISPAQIHVAQGTPNQIIIRGDFPKVKAQQALNAAWQELTMRCQTWIEETVTTKPTGETWQYFWARPWREWMNHTWEFFWATGNSIDHARHNLNQQKNARAWTGINYVGESSTLSGLDSRAWPALGRHAAHSRAKSEEETEVKAFYQQLSAAIDKEGATITEREQLSIPELVKRLVTIEEVMNPLDVERPQSFRGLRRWSEQDALNNIPADAERKERWTGWFQGDGDRAGDYLKRASSKAGANPEEILHGFSKAMREWGDGLTQHLPRSQKQKATLDKDGRIVYAGGDDFLGVLYRNAPHAELKPQECLEWFYRFKPDIWNRHQQPITVSVGLVWASPQVPQRDILQHCRMAEGSAKANGRDRIALRILFSGGNYLEWHCPWRFLSLLQDYRGRDGQANWTHIYNDIAVLEARHAFQAQSSGPQSDIALALLKVYFPIGPHTDFAEQKDPDKQVLYAFLNSNSLDVESDVLWNLYEGGATRYDYDPEGEHKATGILGDRNRFEKAGVLECDRVCEAFNAWVINLAKVGFHLC
jgi:CRISPR-associated protein Cmr2